MSDSKFPRPKTKKSGGVIVNVPTDYMKMETFSPTVTAEKMPPMTDEQLDGMRPAEEVMPDLVASYRRGRGKQKAPTKVRVTMRLDPDLVETLKATGRGWQTRANDTLREALGLAETEKEK